MRITLDEIYQINPIVKYIIDDAKTVENSTCLDYTRYKQRLEKEVGFYCNHPDLKNHVAYEVALNELSKALKI